MPRSGIVALALLSLAACKDGNSDDSNPDDLCGIVDDPGALPDLARGLAAESNCESFQGNPIPGATGYFVGDFLFSCEETETGDLIDTVEGTLTWYLFANDSWKGVNGEDCAVVWYAWGELGSPLDNDPPTCPSCAYTIDVELAVDQTETDCPEALYQGLENGSDAYDVKLGGAPDAEFYWLSGNKAGDGASNDAGATFLIGPKCNWF